MLWAARRGTGRHWRGARAPGAASARIQRLLFGAAGVRHLVSHGGSDSPDSRHGRAGPGRGHCALELEFCCEAGAGRQQNALAQDGEYLPIEPLATCTVWIAIDASTPENGGLRVIPGSHRSRKLACHRENLASGSALSRRTVSTAARTIHARISRTTRP